MVRLPHLMCFLKIRSSGLWAKRVQKRTDVRFIAPIEPGVFPGPSYSTFYFRSDCIKLAGQQPLFILVQNCNRVINGAQLL
jgi:hypothetical protein